jgi:hypothetical protein
MLNVIVCTLVLSQFLLNSTSFSHSFSFVTSTWYGKSMHAYAYIYIKQLTPWNRVLPEKLTVTHLVKTFPSSCGTRRFITMFTSARHWSLSWALWIQSAPSQPISLRSIQIFPPNTRSCKCSFPLRFSNRNVVRISHLSRALYMPNPLHPT